jgi:hypothetical protein
MSRIGKIARRTFLIGSVAIAGGVAFGVYMPSAAPSPTRWRTTSPRRRSPSLWVLIDGERVTLITPHADKGQGAYVVQAALIAEELDIEFGQFEGRLRPAFRRLLEHRAWPKRRVPFRSTDEASRRRHARCRGRCPQAHGDADHGRLHHHARQLRQAARRGRGARDAEARRQPATGIPSGTADNGERRGAAARRNVARLHRRSPRPPRGWSPSRTSPCAIRPGGG